MSIASAVARGQRFAERQMTDSCTVRRRTGETTNPSTGEVTPVMTPVYSGRCRLIQSSPSGGQVTVGEAVLTLSGSVLCLPVSAGGVTTDDVATMDASSDSDLVGRTLRITAPAHQSHGVERRFPVTEISS